MKKTEKTLFPKGFFTKSRPTISMDEALKDVIPLKWSKKVQKGKKKVIMGLAKKAK